MHFCPAQVPPHLRETAVLQGKECIPF